MEIIFIIGSTLSFFLAILVFSKKNKITGDYLLGSYLAVMGLYFTILYLESINIEYPTVASVMGFNIPLLMGPFMFLYVLLMVKTNNKFKAIYMLHGLPYLLFSLYSVLYLYFPDIAQKNTNIVTFENINVFKISFYLVANTIYIIASVFILNKHKKKLGDHFSYTEDIDLVWLKVVVIGFGTLWGVILILHLFNKYPITAISPLGYLIYSASTIYVFLLGYFGFNQQVIYSDKQIDINHSDINIIPTKENEKGERYKKSALKEAEAEVYLENLLNYFEKEKPYLNGQLNLADLSEYLNIPVHHLSQIINERLGKKFFDFVNEYRVREVKARLSNPDHKQYTLLSIAYDSGFNSKSNFNSTFKKITGFTPSQYQKQQIT
jgi:AraC-like DNA-binding protein